MSRNGSKKSGEKASFGGLLSMARFAFAEAGLACNKVIRRVLVPVWAVSFSALSCAVSKPAKSKTGPVDIAAFAEDLFKSRAILRSGDNGVRFQSGPFRKLCGNVSFTFDRNFACNSLIALLLLFCRPSAVLWRVRAIVVDALNRCSGWARPHVLQKVFKPVQLGHPPFANINAAPPVVWVSTAVGISASLLHGLKANIFRNLCASHTAHFSAT